MKTKRRIELTTMLIGVVVAIAVMITACGGGGETHEKATERSGGTPATITFGEATIKSSDKCLDAEWNTVVGKVNAALERAYDKDMGHPLDDESNQGMTKGLFDATNDIQIIISNSAANNIEVKTDDYRTLYLKTSVINNTFDIQLAIEAMGDSDGIHRIKANSRH